MDGVVSSEEEGYAKWPKTTILCISLLKITYPSHKLLDWHGFVVFGKVRLRSISAVVNKRRRIGSITCYSRDDIAARRKVGKT